MSYYDNGLDRAQRSYDNQSDDRLDDEERDIEPYVPEDIDEVERLFVLAKKLIL